MRRAAQLSAAAVLAGGALLVGAQAGAAGPSTKVRIVSPLDPTGSLKASYQVMRHIGSGTCQAGSYQIGTAYRCFSPDAPDVLDPCWPLATATSTMACVAKPWRKQVVELRVLATASGGPSSQPASAPWGFRVGEKIRCLRDVGAVLRINGELLTYHCSHHRDVFGELHTSGEQWRAHVYRTHARTTTGEQSVGWLPVVIAWRGGPLAPPSPSPTPTVTTSPTPSPSPTVTATT